MPLHDTTAFSGTVGHVFAHRFTVEANGDLLLQNSLAAVYTSLSTGTGLISVTTAGTAEFQNVQTSDGDIQIFSESAAIFVDNVKAGSTGNVLRINSETLAELNSDSAADLTADRIILLTNRGIGSVSNALELSGSGLQLTAVSRSGSSSAGVICSRARLVSETSAVGISQRPSSVWKRSSANFGSWPVPNTASSRTSRGGETSR